MTYPKLIKALPPAISPHARVTRNDALLFKAIGEIRRLMAGVAGSAVLIWLATMVLAFPHRLLDPIFGYSYYGAEKKIAKTWNAGPTPKVYVDLFAGCINVVLSTDGRVSAVMTTELIIAMRSQAGADGVVNGIAVSAVHERDTIRIRSANPRKMPADHVWTNVELHVPPGASLDLLTGEGDVHLGQRRGGGPYGNEWVSSPVALKSAKARDLGDKFIGMEAEILSNPSFPATVLDLESRCGSIRIKGDNLLVKAKAGGGGIEYFGRLAAGTQTFVTGTYAPHADAGGRLERGIRLVLPSDMGFEVDAVSARGQVRSEFPATSTSARKQGILTSKVGGEPEVKMKLRSDDGPIEILQRSPVLPPH